MTQQVTLGLDAAGVTTDTQGIQVNDLYTVGDVTGGPAFTHSTRRQAAHAVSVRRDDAPLAHLAPVAARWP